MKKEINKLDFWAKGKDTGHYYHICEGTGDNLLYEDIQDGYVDYIYYEIFDGLQGVYENDECDGGQYLLKKMYQDMSLKQIVNCVSEMEQEQLQVLE